MGIRGTSVNAYHEERQMRKSQEQLLYDLLTEMPGGLSDRQIAAALGLSCALASARRNGLSKALAKGSNGERLVSVDKRPCQQSGKKVNIWAIRATDNVSTRAMF